VGAIGYFFRAFALTGFRAALDGFFAASFLAGLAGLCLAAFAGAFFGFNFGFGLADAFFAGLAGFFGFAGCLGCFAAEADELRWGLASGFCSAGISARAWGMAIGLHSRFMWVAARPQFLQT